MSGEINNSDANSNFLTNSDLTETGKNNQKIKILAGVKEVGQLCDAYLPAFRSEFEPFLNLYRMPRISISEPIGKISDMYVVRGGYEPVQVNIYSMPYEIMMILLKQSLIIFQIKDNPQR